MRRAASCLCLAVMAVGPAMADVIFSTDWDSPANSNRDSVSITGGGAQPIAITGGGDNQPSPAGFWTITDAAKVDLSDKTLIQYAASVVGAASGNDILRKGAVFTTALDFQYTIGSANSQIRYANTGTVIWRPQLNSGSVNDVRFNVLFEIKSGGPYSHWNVQFNYGTADTSGNWYNNTPALNGTADVEIYSVAADGTLSLTSVTFPDLTLPGAGPLYSQDAENMAAALGNGHYLLSIKLTGKTSSQRYTIDNLQVSAIPEPVAANLIVLGAAALMACRRRRTT